MNRFVNSHVFNEKLFLNITTIVYFKLLECADPYTFKITFNSKRIDEICEKCKFSKSSFYRVIDKLKKQGVLLYSGGVVTLLDCINIKNKTNKLPIIWDNKEYL